MFLTHLKLKNPFKNEPLSANLAFSNQIYGSSMEKSELISNFKDSIYSQINSICKNTVQYNFKHFAAVAYPSYLEDSDIKEITESFEKDQYKVTFSKELGFYLVSWNHLYLINK